MKQQILHGIAVILAMVSTSDATARASARHRAEDEAARTHQIDLTDTALLDQIKCQRAPQVARAINAMLANKLIRYVDNESGVYLFVPTAPLTILGLRIRHISGFDYAGFNDVPGSTMVGTAPPIFLEIDVAAPPSELRKRAVAAGLIEAVPYEDKRGFEVSDAKDGLGSYLATEHSGMASSIRCVDYPALHRFR